MNVAAIDVRKMDVNALLRRFDGQSKLLLQSFLNGAVGLQRALCIFKKQRLAPHTWLDALGKKELFIGGNDHLLFVKPMVCLFPAPFKQNLLSFIHVVHSALPRTSVLHLLDCLKQEEPCPNAWVTSLIRQVQRDLGATGKESLFTPQCSQRLKGLCGGKIGGWATCFSSKKIAPTPQVGLSEILGTQRKRKSSAVTNDSDVEDNSQQSKRMKSDLSPVMAISAVPVAQVDICTTDATERADDVTTGGTVKQQHQITLEADNLCDDLPKNIKTAVNRIKEFLDSKLEWDQSSVDAFKVLNDYDPTEVEMLCNMLNLSEAPEQTLPNVCSCILGLSPDLSYSTAAVLVKHLLLEKVISLSEPPSRCLVTAVTSLCTRYPRPTCHALIGPVLEEGRTGSTQAELLNRLIDDCLEPHYRLLVFQMTFKVVWSEGVLSVIHSLLDSKLELNEEQFTLFTEQLVTQAPQFTKSMKFSKMMLTVFTKYNKDVTAAHKLSLSRCVTSNETFLKKSLQAALKRITHT